MAETRSHFFGRQSGLYPLGLAFAGPRTSRDYQGHGAANRSGQEIKADKGYPEARRKVESCCRRKAGADQPGEIGGQGRAGVTQPRAKIVSNRARCLPEEKSHESKSGKQEGILTGSSDVDEKRCGKTEKRGQDCAQHQVPAPSNPVRDVAGGDDRNRTEGCTDDLHRQHLTRLLASNESDPSEGKYGDKVKKSEAAERHVNRAAFRPD
ncbi:hypothetical protein K7A42_12210 [Agrobacterium sp. InxBP2]|uniref:hypothetical protein n=1 Tax=Agrobacterium sp. InxBP2 TaxID=2870329 RepID=UPI00249E7A0F|nr:hypothetical protein [Agrobacterium sp. InxBP2]MCW8281651.1 hypothetical protein [Agrobacterium sp. InxBP2]